MKRVYLLIALLFIPLFAGRISKTITFSQNDFLFEKVDSDDKVIYDKVTLKGEIHTQEIGNPLLPVKSINFLIPAHAEVVKVEVISKDESTLSGSFNIYPAQKPFPCSRHELWEFTPPNKEVYASDKPYPAESFKSYASGVKSGFRIAGIDIYPLHYIPAQQKLILTRSITIELEYAEGVHVVPSLTELQHTVFAKEVRALVTNPENIAVFSPQIRQGMDGIDEVNYVIVTTSALASSFQDLATWRTKQGWKTEVKTTSWIYNNYSGYDNPERIRNFLKDYFANKGLIWVLIGGDADVVPVRLAAYPTDLYYSDLDGTWDANGNHQYGERSDSVDVYADVFVGRLPCDDTTDVANYLSKINTYEKTPPTGYLKKILLPSVWIFAYTWHGREVNNVIAAYTPSDWLDAKLEDPSRHETRDSLNQGYQFCHIAAHGYTNGVGFCSDFGETIFNTSDVFGLTNGTKYNIMNSFACAAGRFDQYDCIAEALVNQYPGACVATIMNARSVYSNAANFSIRFYDFVFSPDTLEIGQCHARTKDYYRNNILSSNYWRLAGFVLTLFGDPALPMWKNVPTTMSVSYPSTIPTGNQSVNISVTNSGRPVSNALVCLYKQGQVHERGYTNASGSITLNVSPVSSGTMFITVTARDCYPFEGTIQVGSGTYPELIYQGVSVIGGNGNGVLEPGETADLVVTLKNIGKTTAYNVTSTLSTSSSYITVNDGSGNFGTINPNASKSNSADPYKITASGSTPVGASISFNIHVVAGTYTKDLPFTLVIGGSSAKKDYYLWNPDITPAPGENMHTILGNLGYNGDYGTSLAEDLTQYKSVLVSVGMYPKNYLIKADSPEAARLVDYLEHHNGRVYLEGGDVWYYDPLYQGGYDFGPLFGINATADGSRDLGPVLGKTGTFTKNMDFNYGGENWWVDHIDPTGTGFVILYDGDNDYNCGVANDAGSYKTVGTSFELGLLTDANAPSTRAVLLDSIMKFFGAEGTTPPPAFSDDFDDGNCNGWTISGLWHVTSHRSNSPSYSLAYNKESDHTYNTGANTSGKAKFTVELPESPVLEFSHCYWTENGRVDPYDVCWVVLYDGSYHVVKHWDSRDPNVTTWTEVSLDLSAYSGTVDIMFYFNSIDKLYNSYEGWYIDDVVVKTLGAGETAEAPESSSEQGSPMLELPEVYSMCQQPNPFTTVTRISYALPYTTSVNLAIYNSVGQIVKQLVNKKMAPGYYDVVWDGTDNTGRKVSAGIYFCSIECRDGFKDIKKIILLK